MKALGDDTTAMRESVLPGMPAVIRGPFGRFSHGKGGDHQVWIAGGVGIGPFLSWLRALDDEPGPGRIDFSTPRRTVVGRSPPSCRESPTATTSFASTS